VSSMPFDSFIPTLSIELEKKVATAQVSMGLEQIMHLRSSPKQNAGVLDEIAYRITADLWRALIRTEVTEGESTVTTEPERTYTMWECLLGLLRIKRLPAGPVRVTTKKTVRVETYAPFAVNPHAHDYGRDRFIIPLRVPDSQRWWERRHQSP